MDVDGQGYFAKPMNCPFHIQVYISAKRSYRELPLRYAELGTVYRYERGGVLHGLMRVRGLTQDDAHIFCTPEQVEDEIAGVLDFAFDLLTTFGFTSYRRVPEYQAREGSGFSGALGPRYRIAPPHYGPARSGVPGGRGRRRLYGPKVDIKVRDAIGRSWQCTTVQFDFNCRSGSTWCTWARTASSTSHTWFTAHSSGP